MHGSVSLQLFSMVWTFLRSLGVIWYDRQVNSEGHKKLLQGLASHEFTVYLSVSNLYLTPSIMAILSKGCKPGNFESYNLSKRITLLSKRILLLIYMVLQFQWRKDFLLHGTYFIQCLTSFFSNDHLLCLYAQFLMIFYVT